MTTDELIRALRENADRWELLAEAADRLEELDERIAIMEEGNKIESE